MDRRRALLADQYEFVYRRAVPRWFTWDLTEAEALALTELLEERRRAGDPWEHYGNSAQSTGLVFYERDVWRRLVDQVDSWLEDHRRGELHRKE